MATDNETNQGQGPEQGQLGGAGASRRRFTRAGLGATGVLLTLNSQPGLAADLVCTAPSNALSGGLQSRQPQAGRCDGRSPGFWKNHDWPPGVEREWSFDRVYPCIGTYRETYGEVSCYDILKHKKFDTANLGMHLMASYLNAMDGRTPFLPVDTLLEMWNQWQMRGYYTPAPDVQWNAADIVIYLQGTMA